MKENGFERSINTETMSKHVQRFIGEDKSLEAVEELLQADPSISKAEVFRRLSAGQGKHKQHVSQHTQPHYEGKLKNS